MTRLRTAEQQALDDEYTLNVDDDVDGDFAILEQDYEDELTATQALNREIARAAAELAEHIEADSEKDGTAEMPEAENDAIDILPFRKRGAK